MKPVPVIFLVSLFLSLVFSACASTPSACANRTTGIAITDAWVRPTTGQPGDPGNSAAYMVLTNCSKEPDRLLKVASDAAAVVEPHKSETINGMMSMSPVASLDLPAGQPVTLKPGDLHIMMMNLNHELTAGQTVTLIFTFEKSGVVTLIAPIINQ